MAGHIATCISCQKLVKPSTGAYHWHAHLLAKVRIILKIYKTRPGSTEGIRVGQKGLFKSTFFDICQMAPNIYPPVSMTNSRHHAKFSEFLTILPFSRVFLVKVDR